MSSKQSIFLKWPYGRTLERFVVRSAGSVCVCLSGHLLSFRELKYEQVRQMCVRCHIAVCLSMRACRKCVVMDHLL